MTMTAFAEQSVLIAFHRAVVAFTKIVMLYPNLPVVIVIVIVIVTRHSLAVPQSRV